MANFLFSKPIAHRGFHGSDAPENSMLAFERAMDHGYAIELDVHLTKDGVPVVFHDETLTRLTDANGKVSDYILKSLKSLRLQGTDQDIPTLQEVLNRVGGRTPLVIELKVIHHDGEMEQKVYDLLKDYDGDYAIQSFNPYTCRWFREHAPEVFLGLLVTSDFSDTKLNFVKQKFLQYMLYLPYIRPDYIGLDYDSFNLGQYMIIKGLTFGKIIFWTIKNQETYKECLDLCDNVIFEGFHPEV
jgi:glycerophosphoryl diester phosphodiesterase